MQHLTIRRLAREAGIGIETVRFCQRRGLIARPPRPEHGFREYSRATLDRLRFIREAQHLGFSLREIEELLALWSGDSTDCAQIRAHAAAKLDIERALAVPMKRFERPMLGFLTRAEIAAVLGQPGTSWASQRDHLLLAMLYNTGARVSEIIGLRVVDVVLDGGACVHLHGKGRKLRSTALLPNRDGQAMHRSNVAQRLELAVRQAAAEQPSLLKKRVLPHTLRHYLPFLTMSLGGARHLA